MSEDKTPAQVEADGDETVTVQYAGHTYTMPSNFDDLDGDFLDSYETGRVSGSLKSLLGKDQWATFKATSPKIRDYKALWNEWARATGFSSGE